MTTEQPLALKLADELMDGMSDEHWNQLNADAAAELRRLHTENEALRSALEHPSDHLEQHLEMVPAELRRLHEAHEWQYTMAGERLRRIEKLEAAVKKLHTAKGRYHTHLAACDLFELCGLPVVRPTRAGEKT